MSLMVEHLKCIGPKKAQDLVLAGFKTFDDIYKADINDIAAIESIGPKTATKIRIEVNEYITHSCGLGCLFEDNYCILHKYVNKETTNMDTGAKPHMTNMEDNAANDMDTMSALADLVEIGSADTSHKLTIYPTGSRAANTATDDSDWDFFILETPIINYYLTRHGWKQVTPDEYLGDPSVSCVWQKGKVHLQMIRKDDFARKKFVNGMISVPSVAREFYKMSKEARKFIWRIMMNQK